LDHLEQIDWLKKRLGQPLPGRTGQERMAARVKPMPDVIPSDARPSAVMSLLFPVEDELHLLFIKRTEDGRAHSGQVSFPGGKQDPIDADLKATALREAQEEVGIMPADVDILGELTPLYIPVSNFQVHPFVAFAKEKPVYNINQAEVRYIMEVSIAELFHSERKVMTDVVSPAMPGVIRNVKAYQLSDGTIIWGATAMILSELETILEELF
jgi:8-oxo-dGTP pyrophosphatase MutT (NUDIX family)